MRIADWGFLPKDEKKWVIRQSLEKNWGIWAGGFKDIILSDDGLDLFDAFVSLTKRRMETHNHFGSRAIIEHLRHHSEKKDGGKAFKINNNYNTDYAILSQTVFPELNEFFECRRLKKGAA